MIKKLFTGRMTSRKRFAGKSDFSAKQVSTTLLLLLLCLLMPQGLKAQSVDGLTANETYDFVSLAQQSTTINWGDAYTGTGLYNSPKYMDNINGTSMGGRFASATNSSRGWWLRNQSGKTVGLYCYGASYSPQLAICDMWNGDRVRITFVGGIKFVEANSAKVNNQFVTAGQEFTGGTLVFSAVKTGDVIIEGIGASNSTIIQKVEFFYSGNGHSGDWTVSFNPSSINLEGGQTYSTNANVTPSWVTPTFTSSDNRVATVDENGVVTAHRIGTATITAKMDVGPEGNQYSHHSTAEMTVNVTSNEPVDPTYSYDPAVEIYDLSDINTGNASLAEETLGYNLNGTEAHYLANPSGYSLNNRLTASQTDFIWANGLKTNLSNNQWRILAINGLIAGDRVVITYSGTTMEFGSNSTNNEVFAAAGIVFKDEDNNGEHDEGEVYLQGGNQVESGMIYTMEQDGHLDIRVPGGAIITKIEIYGDHQAAMEDRYNGSAATGYTAYFSSTGQLIAKEHIVPGGLEVHIGNEDNNQHAIVVSSDQGPVSFVYDQGHYKMARQSDNGSNITAKAPATGTFYKFMPEVDGYLTVNFKAYNIKYNDYWNGNGLSQGNEVVATSGTCPYYIMVKDVNNNFGRYVHPNGTTQYAHDLSTGDNDKFENIRVTAGNTYYVYGWWSKDPQGREPGTEGWNLGQSNCGVAQLIDVTFIPDNMVTPLAKWVANTNWVDESVSSSYVEELADVTGFSTNDVRIKMKSANITGCTAYIENNKLKITGVTFAEGTNPGGTILIKLGDPSNDSNPVFAYTIAYDASFNMPEGAVRSEGHTWDFSTNSLNGLKWNNDSGEFEVKDFKKADDTTGLLYAEMHEEGGHSDWTKTWRVINSAGEGTHDLMFLNKYDMEGDNADMMWDTEGLIFQTSSNQSCINNEFGGVVDHSKFGTQKDPDRYVGILPGGSFTIPALKKGDRVEIFMGSGDGSGSNACKLNITGALDAIGKAIDPAVIYNGGGSPWEYNKGGESRYRGAYQFISTGGDMTFTMNGGSMTKLYTIKIYRGAKTATVDCTRNQSQTYNNDVYDSYTYSFNNDWRTTTSAKSAITLHYRGKGERLRTPYVVHQSGIVSTGSENLFYAEVGDNNAPFIFYKSKIGDYGMFRMRVEDLELGNQYVADYALQNITVGYLEKKNYPYTWDFTDLLGYVDQETLIQREQTKVANYDPRTIDDDEAYEIEFMNNSVGEDVKAVEQWKEYDADGDIPAGYGLQINNEPYGGGCMWSGGQLYAGDQPFGETYFLSIKVPESLDNDGKLQPDINKNYNGGVRITNEGLCLTGGKWTITLPQVGTIASVYVRAKQVGNETIYAAVGDILENASFTYEGTATDGTGDKIYAVKGTGEDMKLMFNNLIIKKIAISQDPKTVNKLGYATESRNVVIDPELMGYMTGTGLKAYTVDNVTYGDNAGDVPTIRLTEIPMENVMGKATNTGDHRGYIIYNTDDAVIPEGATEGTKAVSILDGGFHLFVPDVHDDPDADSKKTILDTENGKNHLRSCYQGGSIPQEEKINGVSYTNYLMNYKYIGPDGKQHEGPEAFYRAANGASLGVNKAYLQLLTEKVKPSEANGNSGAKFAIVFVNEEQGTETTSLDGVKSTETLSGDNAIYTLSGVKVSKPEKGGIYVKNGKKFMVK